MPKRKTRFHRRKGRGHRKKEYYWKEQMMQAAIEKPVTNNLNMYKNFSKDEKSSDEESIHLILEADDENEDNVLKNGKCDEETEEDIMNKFDLDSLEKPEINIKDEKILLDETEEFAACKPVVDKKCVTVEENGKENKTEDCKTTTKEDTHVENDFKDDEKVDEKGNKDVEDTKTVVENHKKVIDTEDVQDSVTVEDNKKEAVEGDTKIGVGHDKKETAEDGKEDVSEKENITENNKEQVEDDDKIEEMADDQEKTTATIPVNKEANSNEKIEDIEDDATRSSPTPEKSESEKNGANEEPKGVKERDDDKCENSNESQNMEEDLLDISIIRDADEDNASAIAENATYDAAQGGDGDKSSDDNDETSNDKLETDDMESENSTNLKETDNTMECVEEDSELTCHKERENGSAVSDCENKSEGNEQSKVLTNDNDSVDEENISDKLKTDDEKADKTTKDGDVEMDEVSDAAAGVETDEKNEKAPKRSLSETDEMFITKKIKLSDVTTVAAEEDDTTKKTPMAEMKTLITFSEYMQDKKVRHKLTRSDLEQFCLQKICEALVHRTSEGALHEQIKKHEQTIETLRKDVQQLTKQTKDLEIVNKKLTNEVKQLITSGEKGQIIPLKITRSVGLQVKLSGVDAMKRRQSLNTSLQSPQPKVVSNPTTPIRPINRVGTNNNVVRQTAQVARVLHQSPTKPAQPTNVTPLLSQALQTRRPSPTVAKRTTQIRPKGAVEGKSSASVIDLTDEDDKKSVTTIPSNKITYRTVPLKTMAVGPNSNLNKGSVGQNKTMNIGGKIVAGQFKNGTATRTLTNLPQGVRLTQATQIKNGITLPGVVTTSAQQLMYVVQPTTSSLPQGLVSTTTSGGTPKAVIVNFQPTNGMITPTINGSAVSVIPKNSSNIQLKQTPAKHPAPLPKPPLGRTPPNDSSYKPVPPKPHLSIRKTDTGIILQWKMPYNLDLYENIASYQLYAYQETNAPPSTDMWRKVGDVKALALPMACTLTQFADKNKYYFAVRSVDVNKRIGPFSDPEEISL